MTNQKSSGRCWLFAGLNTIRHGVRKDKDLKNLEFSQIYLTFWDKLEKSNTFLERMIQLRDRDLMDREVVMALQMPVEDGGYWENVADLVNKYGLVPKEVYPETNSSEATRSMNAVLEQLLRADAVKLRRFAAQVRRWGSGVGKGEDAGRCLPRIGHNLGEPPTEFVWQYEPGKGSEQKDDGRNGIKTATARGDNEQDIEELAMTPLGSSANSSASIRTIT